MNLKGIIFDLDGTLIDSMPLWNNLGEEYLKFKNIIPPEGIKEILKPLSMIQAAKYFKSKCHVQNTEDEIINQINSMMETQYKKCIPLKPCVLSFLTRMKASGIRMCIATATDRPLVEAALERLDILKYFDGIITCTEAGFGKDSPNIYNMALEILKTRKDETIIVEDALHAAETAKKAGFLVAGIYDESAKEDTKDIKSTVDWYFDSFDEWEVV